MTTFGLGLTGRKDGSGDVDFLLRQHLMVVGVAGHGKTLEENRQIGGVRIRRGHDLRTRIAGITAGVSVPVAADADNAGPVGLSAAICRAGVDVCSDTTARR